MNPILFCFLLITPFLSYGYTSFEARAIEGLSAEDLQEGARRMSEILPAGATESHKKTIQTACARVVDWERFKDLLRPIIPQGMAVWQKASIMSAIASIEENRWSLLQGQLDYFGLPLLDHNKRFGLVIELIEITPRYWPLLDFLKPYCKTPQEELNVMETLYVTLSIVLKTLPERQAFAQKMRDMQEQKLQVIEWIVRARNLVAEALKSPPGMS